MNKYKLTFFIVVFLGLSVFATLILTRHMIVLEPKGIIARKEINLIYLTDFLMLLVVIPVFAMTFFFAWIYRAGNEKAKYRPDWERGIAEEVIWWGVPCAIILVLSIVTWKSTHDLDPYKPLVSKVPPITIDVVALDWKWLFIYPEQGIATVNYVEFPEQTPINFVITADAPMNSFWIPQLGGQIYAMAGMKTQLHLMADGEGNYAGSSANFSGRGFAGMKFIARSTTRADYDRWIADTQAEPKALDRAAYAELAQPSQNNKAAFYGRADKNLFNAIVMKYMRPEDKVPEAMPDMVARAPQEPASSSMLGITSMPGMAGMATMTGINQVDQANHEIPKPL